MCVKESIKELYNISQLFIDNNIKHQLDWGTLLYAYRDKELKVEDNEGNIATARSSDGDIVIASTEAMIDGINKILTKKKISSPKEQLANP